MGGVNWQELHTELLEAISARVLANNIADYIRFSAVCKRWRSLIQGKPHLHLRPHIPCIMFLRRSRPWFYNFADNKIYLLKDTKTHYCEGHCHGWLVNRQRFGDFWRVYLLNPITRDKISLPSLHKRTLSFQAMEMCKTRICTNPTSAKNNAASCIVTTIFHGYHPEDRLAFCRLGDANWTIIQDPDDKCRYEDIIYWKGQIYALDMYGSSVAVCDVSPSPVVKRFISPIPFSSAEHKYLIESSGDLLFVGSLHEKFQVFRLGKSSQEWHAVESLGDRSLFLSYESSFSLFASSHPRVKRNCIYFLPYSNKYLYGIFNIGDGSVEYAPAEHPFYVSGRFWITPSLW